jgi:hypothetical protein
MNFNGNRELGHLQYSDSELIYCKLEIETPVIRGDIDKIE